MNAPGQSSAARTQREAFQRWHGKFMQLLDAFTMHAHRHRIQPKNAEVEARAQLLAHARTRLDKHLIQTEWFADWLDELMQQADSLASLARQESQGSAGISRARQAVEQQARKIPGDEFANIDWQYFTVVYRLGPEDSISDILEHPCRYSHASGNSSIELNKARQEALRLESKLRDQSHVTAELERQNARQHAGITSATQILQKVLLSSQGQMEHETVEAIHDFFKNGSLGAHG